MTLHRTGPKHTLGILAVSFLSAVVTTRFAAAQAPSVPSPQDHVAYLTSRATYGRGYVHDGHKNAADYIARQFEAAGLEPLGQRYFQRFLVTPDLFPASPQLAIDGRTLVAGREYLPVSGSAPGKGNGVSFVRAGNGVALPELGINDFAVDIAGRAVLVQAGLPDSLVAAKLPQIFGSIPQKARAAAAAGAACLLIEVPSLVYGTSMPDTPIPVFEVLSGVLDETHHTVSFELTTQRNAQVETANVAGFVRGTSQPDSVVLLAAHYDHLGGFGDSLFFAGANDNASGTAMLLDLAYQYGRYPPTTSVVFVAFSGEELGLLGSRYFVEHPLVPLESIVVVLNFDMIASGETGLVVSGGNDYRREYDQLAAIALTRGLGPIRPRAATPISDHFPFTTMQVPALYIYTSDGKQPYHHVDDIASTLEWDDYLTVRELVVAFLDSARNN